MTVDAMSDALCDVVGDGLIAERIATIETEEK